MLRKITYLLFLGLFTSATAQDSLMVSKATWTHIDAFMLNVPGMVDSALANSPDVRAGVNEVDHYARQTMTQRRNLWRAVTINGGYSFGNTAGLTVSESNMSTDAFSLLSTTNTSLFTVGLGFRLPVSDVVDRKNAVKKAESFMEFKRGLLDQVRMDVEAEVLTQYNALILAQNLVEISSEGSESADLNLTMIRLMFSKGEAEIADLNRALEARQKAQIMFEEAKTKYRNAYTYLELMCGAPLTEFIQ